MKLIEKQYSDVIESIKDPNSEYFGGTTAYLTIANSLALLIKIFRRKKEKDDDSRHTYETLEVLCEACLSSTLEWMEKDAEIFAKIKQKDLPNKDDYIELTLTAQIGYVLNLQTLKSYLIMLIQETTTSLKADYQMVNEYLKVSIENLVSIMKYECHKVKDEMLKVSLEQKIIAL